MAKRPPPTSPKRPANLSAAAVPDAIRKLQRRLREFEDANPETYEGDLDNLAESLCSKLDGTLVEIFGQDTLEFERAHVRPSAFYVGFISFGGGHPHHVLVEAFQRGRAAATLRIKTMVEFLTEQLEDSGETGSQRVLRAYEGLELHSTIAGAASELYLGGHYANAIEDAVKALNNLVRLKSGLDEDGSRLMQRAFGGTDPLLRFNDLADEPDKDEQTGFMMMFSGAVAGLRNPRAHKLIEDDAERALEFIAFISLLAKLLDSATKQPRPKR